MHEGRPMAKLTLLPILLVVTGCATTSVEYAQIAPARPRAVRAAADVAVLFREPTCTFDELGLLEVTSSAYGSSLQEQVDLLRVEAGQRGANAIIMLGHSDSAAGKHHSSVRHAYSALAISIASCATVGKR